MSVSAALSHGMGPSPMAPPARSGERPLRAISLRIAFDVREGSK